MPGTVSRGPQLDRLGSPATQGDRPRGDPQGAGALGAQAGGDVARTPSGLGPLRPGDRLEPAVPRRQRGAGTDVQHRAEDAVRSLARSGGGGRGQPWRTGRPAGEDVCRRLRRSARPDARMPCGTVVMSRNSLDPNTRECISGVGGRRAARNRPHPPRRRPPHRPQFAAAQRIPPELADQVKQCLALFHRRLRPSAGCGSARRAPPPCRTRRRSDS